MSSREYDALVVGAGPAGTVAAAMLARSGLRVLLAGPPPKACSSTVALPRTTAAAVEPLLVGAELKSEPLDTIALQVGGRTRLIPGPG